MSEEATAIAATLRACVREGDEYEAISRIGLRAADMLERQAAQLAALRAGADTEDLHATPEAFKALEAFASARNVAADRWQKKAEAAEAEAETLHAAAEGWRKRAEAAEAKLTGPLPCDVKIPGTLICAGVKVEALLLAISRREPGTKLLEPPWAISSAKAGGRRQALKEAAAAIRALADKPAAGGEA